MRDELKEIERIPEFACGIDPRTLAEIKTEEAREMAIYLDKEMQRNRFVAELAMDAYNLGVRNENFRRRYGSLIVFLFWFGSIVVGVLAAKFAGLIWK